MKNIENYRKKIDEIDFRIIELLAQRMKIVEEIGGWKRENKISFFDQERYAKMIECRVAFAQELGLDEDFVKNIFQIIHKASLECEKKK
ncbi:MAG: chorismate mutase [Patescibacteria group bacterium]|nr:chorismate mutase [Patescibacteria group bacterium]